MLSPSIEVARTASGFGKDLGAGGAYGGVGRVYGGAGRACGGARRAYGGVERDTISIPYFKIHSNQG